MRLPLTRPQLAHTKECKEAYQKSTYHLGYKWFRNPNLRSCRCHCHDY